MQRFLRRTPKREFWPKVWLVHNVYPGPPDDPGRHRMIGLDGFRIWITDEADKLGHRCHCGWLDGREHYGTVSYVDEHGACWNRVQPIAATG